jgi:hypothetical protein
VGWCNVARYAARNEDFLPIAANRIPSRGGIIVVLLSLYVSGLAQS